MLVSVHDSTTEVIRTTDGLFACTHTVMVAMRLAVFTGLGKYTMSCDLPKQYHSECSSANTTSADTRIVLRARA
jgi:hypothetical protein